MMRKLSLALALVLWSGLAWAQSTFTMPPPAGVTVMGVQVVTSCGGVSLTANAVAFVAMNAQGQLCTNAGGTTVTATQGNKGTNAQAWWVEIGDTTNGPASVKAASTAPASTDLSLVVGINPNSVNANGQATKANSAPVTIASDQYADPCASGVAKSSVVIAITSATTTSLVAVSGSTAVYVCGFSVSASNVVTTANILSFEYGTGASCTGTHALTGGYGTGSVLAAAPSSYAYGNGSSTIFSAPAANGICAVTTIGGSGAFEGVLTYVQQ